MCVCVRACVVVSEAESGGGGGSRRPAGDNLTQVWSSSQAVGGWFKGVGGPGWRLLPSRALSRGYDTARSLRRRGKIFGYVARGHCFPIQPSPLGGPTTKRESLSFFLFTAPAEIWCRMRGSEGGAVTFKGQGYYRWKVRTRKYECKKTKHKRSSTLW